MKLNAVSAVFLAAGLLIALPAQAITFDFFWSADPTLDATLLSSDDPTITVTGTMDINVAPGASFTLSDIANVNLSVTGQSIFDFTITEWTDAAGTVASDGRSASFAGSGNNEPFAVLQGNGFFGCVDDACSGADFSELAVEDRVTGQLRFFDYTSPEAALASMRMTASATAIPLPAGLPLLLAGLGALGVMRRAQPAIAPTVMIHPNGGAPLS